MEKKIKVKGKMMDVEICDNVFSQCLGLMFGLRKKPLLFVFKNKKKRAIHSFFCKPFVAIWFNNNEIIDVKVVGSWRFYIKPKEKFDKLLEIPSGNENFGKFIDESRNI